MIQSPPSRFIGCSWGLMHRMKLVIMRMFKLGPDRKPGSSQADVTVCSILADVNKHAARAECPVYAALADVPPDACQQLRQPQVYQSRQCALRRYRQYKMNNLGVKPAATQLISVVASDTV